MRAKLGQQFPEKEKYVQEVFQSIAPIYDHMNMVMSLGLVRKWRQALLAKTALKQGDKVLDVGTGTGELAFLLARQVGSTGEVHGLDFSPRMLDLAQQRMTGRVIPGWGTPITFLVGDALSLPYPEESFQCVTTAFVLRNVNDIPLAISEMVRVCKSGGRVACLDISQPRGIVGWGFNIYFHGLIPLLGRLIGWGKAVRGRVPAYSWLSKSLLNYPQGEDMARIFRECGLLEVSFQPLSMGLSTIYWGTK